MNRKRFEWQRYIENVTLVVGANKDLLGMFASRRLRGGCTGEGRSDLDDKESARV
jgi:hypothetical protein